MLRFSAACALFLTTCSVARAFCYDPKLRVDDEFFVSKYVITATLINDKKLGLDRDGDYTGHNFTWRVLRVYRGSIQPNATFITYSGNDSGRFPLEAEEGHLVSRKYLLFVGKNRDGLYVDNCGNSDSLLNARQTLNELARVGKGSDGLIYGSILWRIPRNATAVAINVDGKGRHYETTLRPDDTFAVSVPPGMYRVTARASGLNINPYDLSHKDPKSLTVPKGGSAGVAFEVQGPP